MEISKVQSKARTPKRTQVDRVMAKFGGPRRFVETAKEIMPNCKINYSTVYRWSYPRAKGGTGGIIPNSSLPLVVKIARLAGVYLSHEDLYPGRM